jgi:mRNA interferase RelE/StbE
MAYQVLISPAASKAVAKLPKETRTRIADRLATLSDNPGGPGSVKLTGQDAYRVRVGDYRIIYTI